MAHSIGMTGMDPQTSAALTEALLQATRQLGGAWRVVDDQDADFVFVDMDSMYGPMSWIRLHANGKRVIGVTSASRSQTDFHLAKPFDGESVAALLQSIAQVPAATPAAASQPAAPAEPPPTATATPAPTPSDLTPEETVSVPDEEQAPASVEAIAAPSPPPTPEPQRDPVFVDWMVPGALSGRVRYRRGKGPALLIDADARQYHGPAALKPLADSISGTVQRHDFLMVPATDWPAEAKAAGEPQPLARLQWYAGLVAGHGILLAGYDPQAKYRLTKWPQTEREFPKHFRIATVMMKGQATLAEIAEGSGVGIEEVTDFVNANLATGYAEAWREPEPSPEPQKPGGLFGRLRGR
ncbi:hypothetical protein FNZ56_05640 [Pseudoluteimonas lycopersici]|uniref:Uncharacterized protein n=1 Tax=Pseudoluteimonas lycopersici TaxID=1324796 RepID=A0A516V4C9_9GAMM|nr:hypothetical protein [Lysobacter lycopersici]QDQ73388.1 hypothetical protein FNZ56_05640 [Lysobacter lycopersici]